MTRWIQRDLFGGVGEVEVADALAGAPLPSFPAVLACSLAPGGSVGAHVQDGYDEVVVFTGGAGRVEVDGVGRAVVAGDVVGLRCGAVLAIANAADDAPLCYVIAKARA